MDKPKTEKKYTLVHRGREIVNTDDLEMLRKALCEDSGGPSTYIRYNKGGRNEYSQRQL